MLKILFNKHNLLIILHIAFGVLFLVGSAPLIICSIIVFYAIFDVVNKRNKNNRSFLWVTYFIAAEVFFRMTGGLFSWELVKYLSILLLFIGVIVEEGKTSIPASFLFYLLLILIGVSNSEVPEGASMRKSIVFNLLGPVVLGVCAIFFYKKKISLKLVYEAMFYSVLPIISMVIFLYFRTPDIREINFTSAANFETSGGFGPNQVSTALGYGVFAIGLLIIAKQRITGFVLFDVLLFMYVFYRSLITFSRGGLITGIAALIVFAFFYALANKDIFKVLTKYILVSVVIVISTWIYTSEITGGMLTNRYLGQNAKGVKKADITSGRANIMRNQFESFMENPILGIGVGNGKYKRKESGHKITAAAHNEVGRIVEEHGLIGMFSLLLLLIVPLLNLKNQSTVGKGLTLSFYLLWFLTINHSAMRIAFPGVIYGLSLIKITHNED